MRKYIALCSLILSACAHSDESISYLTPNTLHTTPEKFVGQTVYVKGYVVLGTNARCLISSKERYKTMNDALDNDETECFCDEDGEDRESNFGSG